MDVNDIKEQLQVTVISPEDTLFSGPALTVSSKNKSGNFDILPEHANFVTFIENSPITILKPDHQKVTFQFSMGIIYASDNVVNVYTQPEMLKI